MPTTKTSSKTSTKKKTTPKPLKRVIIKQTDRTIRFSYISLIILFIIILLGGLYFYNFTYVRGDQGENEAVQVQEEKHVAFLLEIFDKIQENYWEVITGQDLFNIYKAGLEKLEKQPEVIINSDRTALKSILTQVVDGLSDELAKKEFSVYLATIVLYNLQPVGRSGLFTTQKETDLWNNVKNIDPNTNLYTELDVTEDASTEEIAAAADEVEEELQDIINDNDSTEEELAAAQQKLAVVDRARETLTQEAARQTYNTSGVEATVYGEMLTDEILHMTIKKMSPTSFTELQQVANEFDQYQNLDTLILDLRGNIGGSVDLMPYFLGPFIGPNQYAYESYHQGEYEPYKTLVGWLPSLVRYKNVIILQDEIAQSSAEVMTSVLKKYNVGILVGTTSRGWGTIEAVYELTNQISDDETYKMFLVNAVTLRDDGQPIEGRGVDPVINVADENWPDLLYTYVNDNALVRAVEKLID